MAFNPLGNQVATASTKVCYTKQLGFISAVEEVQFIKYLAFCLIHQSFLVVDLT